MALSTASLVASAAAVTAGADATAKTTALLSTLVAAVVKEVCGSGILTPAQQNRVAQLQAELADNVATYETALTVE